MIDQLLTNFDFEVVRQEFEKTSETLQNEMISFRKREEQCERNSPGDSRLIAFCDRLSS